MRKRKLWSLLVAVAVGAGAVATVAPLGGSVGAVPAGRVLDGSVPVWATPSAQIGQAPDGERVQIRVYLPWRHGEQAARLATAVSTPGRREYGRHLSTRQFRDRFSPTRGDVREVVAWLRDHDLEPGYVPDNRHYVSAVGTIEQIEDAFGTQVAQYRHEGHDLRAPSSKLRVPDGLPVSAVVGVDESARLARPGPNAGPFPQIGTAGPCSRYWGEKTTATAPGRDGTRLPDVEGKALPWAPCGYEPAQIRGAYGMDHAVRAGRDGRGVSVAVVNAHGSDTITADVRRYSQQHGLPRPDLRRVITPGTIPAPPDPCGCDDPPGWGVEETLDLEAVHAMAPGARLVSVIAPHSNNDLDAALNHAVDEQVASIISNSYGFSHEDLPPAVVAITTETGIQAAITGIGLYFSAGNDGDDNGGDPANHDAGPNFEASSPWVTAVGGTSLAIDRHNRRLFETGWQTGISTATSSGYTPALPGQWAFGGSGGTSKISAQPAYQAGVVPDELARSRGGQPMRVVPDVAALGDTNIGFLVGRTALLPDGRTAYTEHRIGGTSLAGPLFAATIALAEQGRRSPVGFANPMLYHLRPGALNDVRPTPEPVVMARADYRNGANDADGYTYTARSLGFDQPLTIHTRDGYDDITGLGTPNGTTFLTAIHHQR